MTKTKDGERTETGIAGFDKLCEGGLIRDSLNIVIGNAGAGKTTFLLQFLYNGATKFDEPGLYVSFESEIASLFIAAKKQGMDFEKIKNKCFFLKIDDSTSVKEVQERIMKIIVKNEICRICLDPINVFAIGLDKEANLRKQIYEFLALFKKLDVCVLVAGEADEEIGNAYNTSEEIKFCKYSVDGIIELYSSGLAGVGDRALRISKMRMTNHKRGPVGMEITDKGIVVSGRK